MKPKLTWNDTIQELAQTHWKPRKPIPGIRFYDCHECGYLGSEKSRDCQSPSKETCSVCHSEAVVVNYEEHPEWLVDKSGNLIEP